MRLTGIINKRDTMLTIILFTLFVSSISVIIKQFIFLGMGVSL